MVFVKSGWHPVKEVVCSRDNGYITMVIDEVMGQNDDRIVWRNQIDQAEPEDKTIFLVLTSANQVKLTLDRDLANGIQCCQGQFLICDR